MVNMRKSRVRGNVVWGFEGKIACERKKKVRDGIGSGLSDSMGF